MLLEFFGFIRKHRTLGIASHRFSCTGMFKRLEDTRHPLGLTSRHLDMHTTQLLYLEDPYEFLSATPLQGPSRVVQCKGRRRAGLPRLQDCMAAHAHVSSSLGNSLISSSDVHTLVCFSSVENCVLGDLCAKKIYNAFWTMNEGVVCKVCRISEVCF